MNQVTQALLRKKRERVVELDGADSGRPENRRRKIIFLRPSEEQIGKLLSPSKDDPKKMDINVGPEHVREYVTGWENMTEADFLGEAIGASDIAVPFDKGLWDEVVGDNSDWRVKVEIAILDSVVKHYEQKAEAAKNSAPASTATSEESKASS